MALSDGRHLPLCEALSVPARGCTAPIARQYRWSHRDHWPTCHATRRPSSELLDGEQQPVGVSASVVVDADVDTVDILDVDFLGRWF